MKWPQWLDIAKILFESIDRACEDDDKLFNYLNRNSIKGFSLIHYLKETREESLLEMLRLRFQYNPQYREKTDFRIRDDAMNYTQASSSSTGMMMESGLTPQIQSPIPPMQSYPPPQFMAQYPMPMHPQTMPPHAMAPENQPYLSSPMVYPYPFFLPQQVPPVQPQSTSDQPQQNGNSDIIMKTN